MSPKTGAPGSKRCWKHHLLGVLLLSNVAYIWMVIARSPETIRANFSTIAAQQESSFMLRDDESATPMVSQHDNFTDFSWNTSSPRRLKCLGWRATGDCNPDGPRIPDKDLSCSRKIPDGTSGYCVIEDENTHERFRVMKKTCSKGKPGAIFQCSDAPGFANFRVEAQTAVDKALTPGFALPNVNSSRQNLQRGIAIVVYPKLVASAYATIRTLRDVLGCRLPIEIWFRPNEMDHNPEGLDTLKNLAQNDTTGGITFEDIDNPHALRFNAKIHAIYHSKFDEVLFLDADNVPVQDPSYLFQTPEFVKTGAVFWPDYWHPDHTIFYVNKDSLVWELIDTPFVDMFEQESGQVLVDRRRHAAALELVTFYGLHRPNYFDRMKLVWGDKDLFRLAWLKLGAPFHMIPTPPSVAGRKFDQSFCGMTMVQHDTNGEVLFLHRNQMKLTGKPRDDLSLELQKITGEFPDPVMWTHLVSFRNSSSRSEYVIQAHNDHRFSKQRRCFGRQFPEKSSSFYTREFADLAFAGIETHVRRFAMEAVMHN